jgi:hypothetical protein
MVPGKLAVTEEVRGGVPVATLQNQMLIGGGNQQDNSLKEQLPTGRGGSQPGAITYENQGI